MWPWRRRAERETELLPVAVQEWPTIIPPDLAPWFPIARPAVLGGNWYVIGVAACAECGAAVPLFEMGDFTHLRQHVKWHGEPFTPIRA